MATNDAFGKFMSSVNKGIATINVKSASFSEKSRIKTHVDSLNQSIQQDYAFIGDLVYRLWESKGNNYIAIEERLEVIKSKYAEVANLNAQLAAIEARDNEILGNNQGQQQVVAGRFICSNCGAQYEVKVNFCRRCGKPI